MSIASGVSPLGTPLEEAIRNFRSCSLSTASSGIWSATNASATQDAINASTGNPELQAKLQRKANIISFSVSMASAFGSVLALLGLPIGYWTMGAIGVTGLLYALKLS